jgi:hypothetical protein
VGHNGQQGGPVAQLGEDLPFSLPEHKVSSSKRATYSEMEFTDFFMKKSLDKNDFLITFFSSRGFTILSLCS